MAVNGVMILPMVVGFLGVAGVFLKLIILLKITSVLAFLFFFWYVLVAGVQYTLYAVLAGFCDAQATIINQGLGSVSSQYQSNGTVYNTSDAIAALLNCSGNTTFVSVFHNQYIIDNIETLISATVNQITQQAYNTSFNSTLDSINSQLQNFTTAINNLNFTGGADFNQTKIVLTSAYNNVLAGKDGNQTALSNDITSVNNQLQACAPTQYTQCYIASNATYNLFDANCATTCDPTDKQNMNNTWASGLPYYTIVYVVIPALNQSVQDVDAMIADVNTVTQIENDMGLQTKDIQLRMTQTSNNTENFIVSTAALAGDIGTVVDTGLVNLEQATECAFVGEAYGQITDGLCHKFGPSLQVIAAMMMLGAVTLFGTVIHSCLVINRINASGGGDSGKDEDAGGVSMEARDKA